MPKLNLNQPILVLGFDFGMKHIGVAIGQSITQSANPLGTLAAKNGTPDWQEIAKLIAEWQPQALIVGIPQTASDKQQINVSKQAEKFAEQLARFDLPVFTVDERLTTKEARRFLFDKGGYRALKKSAIDSFAAKLIVESWLSTRQKI